VEHRRASFNPSGPRGELCESHPTLGITNGLEKCVHGISPTGGNTFPLLIAPDGGFPRMSFIFGVIASAIAVAAVRLIRTERLDSSLQLLARHATVPVGVERCKNCAHG
jgi:hypothetical protein